MPPSSSGRPRCTPSFAISASRMPLRDRTEQADFLFRIRSCAPFASRTLLRDECVALRRETSAPSRAFCLMKSLFSPPHTPQFATRNPRQRAPPRLQRPKPAQHLPRLFPPDVNANVRVQQEARVHHSPLRFCGLSFFRPVSLKSAGNAASKSKARAIVPARSRSTISSPRREISTSLLFTRNALGSRTAWLFPHLNTFALPILNLLQFIYR